jgi:hypothetical protein
VPDEHTPDNTRDLWAIGLKKKERKGMNELEEKRNKTIIQLVHLGGEIDTGEVVPLDQTIRVLAGDHISERNPTTSAINRLVRIDGHSFLFLFFLIDPSFLGFVASFGLLLFLLLGFGNLSREKLKQ